MVPMLGNIGPLEIIIVLIIALVVFGPKRLPELGSSLGRGIREFRSTVTGEKRGDEDEDDDVKAISRPPSAPAEQPAEPEVVHDKRT
jgi:sec-independent protein translocase protein TatA